MTSAPMISVSCLDISSNETVVSRSFPVTVNTTVKWIPILCIEWFSSHPTAARWRPFKLDHHSSSLSSTIFFYSSFIYEHLDNIFTLFHWRIFQPFYQFWLLENMLAGNTSFAYDSNPPFSPFDPHFISIFFQFSSNFLFELY